MKDMKELMKMMMLADKKQEGSDMSEKEIRAKMDVLRELLDMAQGEAGKDVVGHLKKVMVAAPDKKGLIEGLDKAKEITSDMPGHDNEEEETLEQEASETPEEQMQEEKDLESTKADEEDDDEEDTY